MRHIVSYNHVGFMSLIDDSFVSDVGVLVGASLYRTSGITFTVASVRGKQMDHHYVRHYNLELR